MEEFLSSCRRAVQVSPSHTHAYARTRSQLAQTSVNINNTEPAGLTLLSTFHLTFHVDKFCGILIYVQKYFKQPEIKCTDDDVKYRR